MEDGPRTTVKSLAYQNFGKKNQQLDRFSLAPQNTIISMFSGPKPWAYFFWGGEYSRKEQDNIHEYNNIHKHINIHEHYNIHEHINIHKHNSFNEQIYIYEHNNIHVFSDVSATSPERAPRVRGRSKGQHGLRRRQWRGHAGTPYGWFRQSKFFPLLTLYNLI